MLEIHILVSFENKGAIFGLKIFLIPCLVIVKVVSIIESHVVISAPSVRLQLQVVKLDLHHLVGGGGDGPGAVGVVEVRVRVERRPDLSWISDSASTLMSDPGQLES